MSRFERELFAAKKELRARAEEQDAALAEATALAEAAVAEAALAREASGGAAELAPYGGVSRSKARRTCVTPDLLEAEAEESILPDLAEKFGSRLGARRGRGGQLQAYRRVWSGAIQHRLHLRHGPGRVFHVPGRVLPDHERRGMLVKRGRGRSR